jgi:hypothetical protein
LHFGHAPKQSINNLGLISAALDPHPAGSNQHDMTLPPSCPSHV